MKTKIHPSYYVTQVSCACGHAFTTRSTRKVIKLDICSNCHPFFTGKQRLLDRAGRVDRFQKRFAKTGGKTISREPKAEVKMKKLEAVMSRKILKKTLSTAPTQAEEAAKAKKGKKGAEGAEAKQAKA